MIFFFNDGNPFRNNVEQCFQDTKGRKNGLEQNEVEYVSESISSREKGYKDIMKYEGETSTQWKCNPIQQFIVCGVLY